MAFDYGSIDLGIKNPFKKDGLVRAITGAVISGLSLYLMISAAGAVKTEMVSGWILAAFGFVLLVFGLNTLGAGVLSMLRYFVGRNHPTSLALNRSKSQSKNAHEEQSYVNYSSDDLKEMLIGRKNTTFEEPHGFLARLLHTVTPKLLFMPYMVRNLGQYLCSAWVSTLIIFVVYGLIAFVTLAGFTGELGDYIFPVYSVYVVFHLLKVWLTAGERISVTRQGQKYVSSFGTKELAKTIAAAILIPVIAAVLIKYGMDLFSLTTKDLDQIRDAIPSLYPILYIFGACIAGVIVTTIAVIMLRRRLELTEPVVEVSELRENWQESVHPNEIFINLDNLVMANRRYKEVPNRVYEELPPNPIEQVAGKGAFHGEMIQEVQPQYKAVEMGKVFDTTRLVSVVLGGFLYVVASILFVALAYAVVDFYVAAKAMGGMGSLSLKQFSVLSQNDLSPVIHYILVTGFVYAFARILLRAGHLFYAEMLFESNLIYMKIEGTFTESKISTGASIHDSTRSENTLVRSSITPWVVVSRLVTSTFASSGMRNLEFPRYILEMHKSDEELNSIKDDIMSFLKDRESIASITSERDLRNASQIYEINQQSRATSTADNEQQRLKEEAGGYIQRSEESES